MAASASLKARTSPEGIGAPSPRLAETARRLAETATRREREGGAPFEEVALLKASGLLNLLAPREFGGAGGTWTEALTVTREIAAADGSIGQLIGYHYVNCAIVELQATAGQRARFWEALVRGNWFTGDSVNPLDPALAVEQDGEDVRLGGWKSFSTGAQVADAILIAFLLGGRHHLALLPADRQGISANGDWDNIGQRLTASGSVSFTDVRVHREEILGAAPGQGAPTPRETLYVPVVHSALSHVLLGIAEGALAAAADYTRRSSRPWITSGVEAASKDPYILAQYGQLAADLSASIALGEEAGRLLEDALGRGAALTAEERGAAAVATYKAKIHSTETALKITAKIFELMGARATARSHGFDRFWRDARTLSLHDPVAYKAKEVGDHFLNGKVPDVTFYS